MQAVFLLSFISRSSSYLFFVTSFIFIFLYSVVFYSHFRGSSNMALFFPSVLVASFIYLPLSYSCSLSTFSSLSYSSFAGFHPLHAYPHSFLLSYSPYSAFPDSLHSHLFLIIAVFPSFFLSFSYIPSLSSN